MKIVSRRENGGSCSSPVKPEISTERWLFWSTRRSYFHGNRTRHHSLCSQGLENDDFVALLPWHATVRAKRQQATEVSAPRPNHSKEGTLLWYLHVRRSWWYDQYLQVPVKSDPVDVSPWHGLWTGCGDRNLVTSMWNDRNPNRLSTLKHSKVVSLHWWSGLLNRGSLCARNYQLTNVSSSLSWGTWADCLLLGTRHISFPKKIQWISKSGKCSEPM